MQKINKIFATVILTIILLTFISLVRLPQIKINFEVTIDQQNIFEFIAEKLSSGVTGYDLDYVPPPIPYPTTPCYLSEPTSVPTIAVSTCHPPTPVPTISPPTQTNIIIVSSSCSSPNDIMPTHMGNVIVHNEKSPCDNNKIYADEGTFSKEMIIMIQKKGFTICQDNNSEYYAIREDVAGSDLISIYSSATGDLIFFSAFNMSSLSREELQVLLWYM